MPEHAPNEQVLARLAADEPGENWVGEQYSWSYAQRYVRTTVSVHRRSDRSPPPKKTSPGSVFSEKVEFAPPGVVFLFERGNSPASYVARFLEEGHRSTHHIDCRTDPPVAET